MCVCVRPSRAPARALSLPPCWVFSMRLRLTLSYDTGQARGPPCFAAAAAARSVVSVVGFALSDDTALEAGPVL